MSKLKDVVDTVGVVRLMAVAAAAMFVGGLALRGAWDFVTEGPAIVEHAVTHIEGHHDTLFFAVGQIDTLRSRVWHHDSVDALVVQTVEELKTGQAFLICLRRERKAELDGRPFTEDCEAHLLPGGAP